MDGVMNERTISVSNSRPEADGGADLTEHPQIAEDERRHGEGEHQAGGGDDRRRCRPWRG